jgi:hypothetical protein
MPPSWPLNEDVAGGVDADQQILADAQSSRRLVDPPRVLDVIDRDDLRSHRDHRGNEVAWDLVEVAHVPHRDAIATRQQSALHVHGNHLVKALGQRDRTHIGVPRVLLAHHIRAQTQASRLLGQHARVLGDRVEVYHPGVGGYAALLAQLAGRLEKPGIAFDQAL